MKLKLILTMAIVGVALALPSVSNAAPPPPPLQDSVVLTEAPAILTPNGGTVDALTATSGPSGENPTGEIRTNQGSFLPDSGPITCLAVNGNTATFNWMSSILLGEVLTEQVVDDSPDTFAIETPIGFRAPTDCSPPGHVATYQVTSGDFKVVDAQPPPTTKDQCKDGGWKQFGFANQGLCIAFVNHGP
ncbi:MAG: hypothetical protein WB462_07600 [Solirubrobacterales bacterium]